MQKPLFKILSFVMAIVLLSGAMLLKSSAANASDLRNEINKLEQQSRELEKDITGLKNQINKQQELKSAIEKKIANTQQQINLCNNEIAKINNTIAANKAEINKKNQEIERDKLSFKKRIRAIYMSNSGNDVQILLGADNFADYLQLSQLTASVSAHDKTMIEKIVAAVEVLEQKQAENNKLLEEQVAIKATIDKKQQELKSENAKIQSVINDINADKSKVEKDNAAVERDIKIKQAALNDILYSNSGKNHVYDGGQFLWPTPGIGRISSGFGSRWGTNHNGVDISNGSFGGKIIAIADGYVYRYSNSCSHNYGKSGNCCGNGYGNYVAVDHGSLSGKHYTAYYAHMSSVAVSNGAFVKKGQVLGYIGSTGWSTGPHLHFGLAVNGTWVDPMKYYRAVQ